MVSFLLGTQIFFFVHRRIQLTCLHQCCHLIQLMWWFIWEVTIVQFVTRRICTVTALKSIVYSFRSTRETLDTALFTIRKFVFTVTLIHESSLCSIPLILRKILNNISPVIVPLTIHKGNNNVVIEKRVAPRFDLNWNEPRSNHVSWTLGKTGSITQDNQQMKLAFTLMKAALGYEQSRKASGSIKVSTTLDTTSNVMHTEDQIEDIV